MRPDTSRTALIGKTDDLADAVERRERVLLDQLRGGKDLLIGDLESAPSSDKKKSLQAAGYGQLKEIGPYRGQETAQVDSGKRGWERLAVDGSTTQHAPRETRTAANGSRRVKRPAGTAR